MGQEVSSLWWPQPWKDVSHVIGFRGKAQTHGQLNPRDTLRLWRKCNENNSLKHFHTTLNPKGDRSPSSATKPIRLLDLSKPQNIIRLRIDHTTGNFDLWEWPTLPATSKSDYGNLIHCQSFPTIDTWEVNGWIPTMSVSSSLMVSRGCGARGKMEEVNSNWWLAKQRKTQANQGRLMVKI